MAAKEEEEKKEEEKDIVKPKRPTTAFIYFSVENRIKIMKNKPDTKMVDCSKISSEEWGKLTDAQKVKFNKMNEKSRERYDKEMKEFNEKGFFHNSDGIKSTFLSKKGKQQEFE